MTDEQLTLRGSVLQHGKSNDRIYLMKYDPRQRDSLFRDMSALAEEQDYGKIFIKIPAEEEEFFLEHGFVREASIAGYFGSSDAVFMGKYLKEERRQVPDETLEKIREVLKTAVPGQASDPRPLEDVRTIRKLVPVDLKEMADIYSRVFASYPFPIHDQEYLRRTMESHVIYFGCFREGVLTGLSSAECDKSRATVEMTDFAVLPENRGRQLALHLLQVMEDHIREEGYKIAYTIARAVSFGMNKTFANAGYEFGGTLWNNTQISGTIECMNIWYKSL